MRVVAPQSITNLVTCGEQALIWVLTTYHVRGHHPVFFIVLFFRIFFRLSSLPSETYRLHMGSIATVPPIGAIIAGVVLASVVFHFFS